MERFPGEGAKDAMKMEGREVGQPCQLLQGQGIGQMGIDVVDHSIDAAQVNLFGSLGLHDSVGEREGGRRLLCSLNKNRRLQPIMHAGPVRTSHLRSAGNLSRAFHDGSCPPTVANSISGSSDCTRQSSRQPNKRLSPLAPAKMSSTRPFGHDYRLYSQLIPNPFSTALEYAETSTENASRANASSCSTWPAISSLSISGMARRYNAPRNGTCSSQAAGSTRCNASKITAQVGGGLYPEQPGSWDPRVRMIGSPRSSFG